VHAGRIDLRLLEVFLAGRGRAEMIEIGLHPAEPSPAPAAGSPADGWEDPLAELRPNELHMLLTAELASLMDRHQLRLGRLSELAA